VKTALPRNGCTVVGAPPAARAPSLEEQAKGPRVDPVEMGMPSFDAVVASAKAVSGYVKQFDQIVGKEGVTIDTIATAPATCERRLVTTPSRSYSFRFAYKVADAAVRSISAFLRSLDGQP
jgi:cytochrome c peroxidase